MSKNLSKGIDKGQGVKKYNSDNSINKEWKNIHWGTPMPKDAQECHSTGFDNSMDSYDYTFSDFEDFDTV